MRSLISRAEEILGGHRVTEETIRRNFGDEAGDRFANRIRERLDEALAARQASQGRVIEAQTPELLSTPSHRRRQTRFSVSSLNEERGSSLET